MDLRAIRSLKPALSLAITEALEGLGTVNDVSSVTIPACAEDVISYLTDAVYDEVIAELEEAEPEEELEETP